MAMNVRAGGSCRMSQTEPLQREPWRSAPPFAVRLLQHRLALHSNAEIAIHYGKSTDTVRSHLKRLVRHLRTRYPLPIHGLSDALVLAERDGVPLERLTRTGSNDDGGLPEGEAHS